jgi:Na+/melibiose symporter-like transporter
LKRIGVNSLLNWLFIVKILVCLMGFFLIDASAAPLLQLAVFFLSNKVFTEVICRHGNLVVSNLIDEDQAAHEGAQSRSALYFGAIALFTKPGQALAAMIGWATLGNAFEDKVRLFQIVTLIPAFCGVVQLAIFMLYAKKAESAKQIKFK